MNESREQLFEMQRWIDGIRVCPACASLLRAVECDCMLPHAWYCPKCAPQFDPEGVLHVAS